MPVNQQSTNRELYGILKSHGYRPDMFDSSGKKVSVPEEADAFQFEFIKDGKKYGKVTVTIDGLHRLIVYYGEEVAKSPSFGAEDGGPGISFTDLRKHLKRFAKNRSLGFELQDEDNLEADMAKRDYNKKEGLNEGYYPLTKTKSYSDNVPSTKIILQHNRVMQEGEQRYRSIEKIYVENVQGERFLLPTNKPGIARVYARHIAEGGTPYDERGSHITSLVEEYSKMAGFVRATKGKQFNESAEALINEGLNHYAKLRETLHRMAGKKGYREYFENYTPALMEDEHSTDLSEMFMQSSLDPRIENVMPILGKLSKNITENEVAQVQELEEWINNVIETTTELDIEQLDEKCWDTHKQVGMKKKGSKMVPNCVPKESVEETVIDEGHEMCPECGGDMYPSTMINEKKDACYYKVKSRYKVWPSAYASGALVKCRKKGAKNWGTKSESIEENEELDENLRKWFKEKWVRFGPDGKIKGPCARGDDSEGKPKCLPQAKAHALGKKGRASAGARKRREDPNPERSGKAINVATKKKTNEAELDEACWKGYHKEGNKKMFGKTYPNCVKNANEDQGVTEMDKSAPQPGRDGRVSHSTYGSRDKGGETGKQIYVKPIKANKAKQDALKDLNKAFNKGVAEGSETNKYHVVVVGHKRSYDVWIDAKNEDVAIIRAQQYVTQEHNDTTKRAAVVDMKKGVAETKVGGNVLTDPSTATHTTHSTIWPNTSQERKLDPLHHRSEEAMRSHIKALKKKYGADNVSTKVKTNQGVAEGADEGLSKYSTERLQAYVKKVSGGGVPAFGSGAKLKRVQQELKRRESGVAESNQNQNNGKIMEHEINIVSELNNMFEDWQKTNRRDKTSGMSRKAVKQYRRENPGSKLQTAVTTKPSKLKKGSKSAKRRKSFCSRMRGMKKSRTSAKTARDPNSNINKALRRWNCESIQDMRQLIENATKIIAEKKASIQHVNLTESQLPGAQGTWMHGGYKINYSPRTKGVKIVGKNGMMVSYKFINQPSLDVYKKKVASLIEKLEDAVTEAANPAQQAAIAISMKKHGKKPKNVKESDLPEGLDSNQKKAGQLGATDKVSTGPILGHEPQSQKGLRGKLVGGESVDPLIRIKGLSGLSE